MSDARRAAEALRAVRGLRFDSDGVGFDLADRNRRRLDGAIAAALAALDDKADDAKRADANAKAVEWITCHLIAIANAAGLDGKATAPEVAEVVRALRGPC